MYKNIYYQSREEDLYTKIQNSLSNISLKKAEILKIKEEILKLFKEQEKEINQTSMV